MPARASANPNSLSARPAPGKADDQGERERPLRLDEIQQFAHAVASSRTENSSTVPMPRTSVLRRRSEADQLAHALVDGPGDQDRRPAVGLDAPGQLHRVAPEVVDELAPADEAADHRAGVDANLGDEAHAALGVEALDDAHDLAGELDHARRVVGAFHRQPRDGQVRRADGANLFDAVLLRGLVARGHDVAEQRHRVVLAELGRQRLEASRLM